MFLNFKLQKLQAKVSNMLSKLIISPKKGGGGEVKISTKIILKVVIYRLISTPLQIIFIGFNNGKLQEYIFGFIQLWGANLCDVRKYT